MKQEENKDSKKNNDLSEEKYDAKDESEEVKIMKIIFQRIIKTKMQKNIMIIRVNKTKKFKRMSIKNHINNLIEIEFSRTFLKRMIQTKRLKYLRIQEVKKLI